MGLACVGTRSGIIPEILGDGTGLLVDPSAPEALATAIGELVVSEQRRRELSQLGRTKAERAFSVSQVTRRKVDAYEGVVGEHA
jgi:glycosyltransferase involved in cell wall biosynthesis